MKYGFLRTACGTPKTTVANCVSNTQEIFDLIKKAENENVEVLVFPELCITSYTCGDLFLQQSLQKSAKEQLFLLAKKTENIDMLIAVGLPVALGNSLYNCAALLYQGSILALIPKTHIPNYSEFYEGRYFTPGKSTTEYVNLSKEHTDIPFGTKILISLPNKDEPILIGTEICEDLWVPCPPSVSQSLCGAQVILNLSASNEVVGKAEYRKMLVQAQSGRLACAYLYANAGKDESTTDLIFSGHNLIAENGSILAESTLYSEGLLIADIDTEKLNQERRRENTFTSEDRSFLVVVPENSKNISKKEKNISEQLYRFIDSHPFVPSDEKQRAQRCSEIIAMQSQGLAKRLLHTHCKSAVIGLSGGLDSTLALLITYEAFKVCSLDSSFITAVTMPCFGTTDRTYQNACNMASSMGVTLREINIKKAVRQHFLDIGHDETLLNVTYENAQARERTQVLMDIANQTNGLVIGTGDLSELALGWATYNGDHMSMYGVNASIPKTLVRYLVAWFAQDAAQKNNITLSTVLYDILDTPVSPELLPPSKGSISQKTEELVGPYELHDFFLYYMLRWGYSPKKIYFLAQKAFDSYNPDIILKWLKVFYSRFFAQQFKRSCLPDGAKVGTVSVSPRGDWRMPSDASSVIWLSELETL
jgi:NAD+ synthase (glutamine-hydrolysing)